MEYKLPFIAIHRDGETREFKDSNEFLDFAFNRSNGRVGQYWYETTRYNYKNNTVRVERSDIVISGVRLGHVCDWIVRDALGYPVQASQVKDTRPERIYPVRTSYDQYQEAKTRAILLGEGPIPGTGKSRKSKCRCKLCRGTPSKNGGRGAALRAKAKADYDDKNYGEG